jgi:hypothetical protein
MEWLNVNNPQWSKVELGENENPSPPAPDGAEQRQKAFTSFRTECLPTADWDADFIDFEKLLTV